MSAIGRLHPAVRAIRRLRTSLLQAGIAILGLGGIALVWGGILYALSEGREATINGAYLNAANLARVFEEALVRSINAVDQTLLQARDAAASNPEHFDLGAWAGRLPDLSTGRLRISLIGKDGILRDSSFLPKASRPDYHDRAYFRELRQSSSDALFISQPVRGIAEHTINLIFARKLIAPDGSFDGAVVILLDPRFLSEYYHSVDLGRKGVIVLIGEDGVWRARAGGADGMGDELIGKAATNSPILAAYRRAPVGNFAATAPVDGISRLYAYRGVRGLPLILAVGFAQDEVLAAYHRNRQAYIILGLLITTLLVAVTAALLVRQSRMDSARVQLRADHALKSELLEKTLENMNQGILMIDAQDRVKVFNQRLIDTFDLPQELLARKPPFAEVLRWLWNRGEFGPRTSDFAAWLAGYLTSPVATQQYWVGEHVRPNGSVVEVCAKVLPDGGCVRTYTDITERKRDEALLRAARDEADRATRAKSEFLATMSHEIRSPMSGLLGVLELLRATALDADQVRMAGMVQNSATMLLAVLNDILDFSKIEAGALTITPVPTDVTALLEDLVAPQIATGRHKGVAVRLQVAPDVPRWIMTDGLRLRQILGNLLSNAVKFTPAGEVVVSAHLEQDGGPQMLCMSVRDSGIGMDAEVVARLFQPFMQADGSTTRRFGGTGLGLCISQQLACLLEGALSVSSQVGVGSIFTLWLPSRPCLVPPSLLTLAAAPVAAGGSAGVFARSHDGLRALVVDDDPTNRWLAQRQLLRLGLHADVAEDGEAGLAALLAAPYDILVTDCHMPRMDGVALTRAVRALDDPARRRIPIIGLTADATAAQRAACDAAGMTEVAIKPVTLAQFSNLITRLTGAGGSAAVDEGTTLRAVAFDDQILRAIFEPGDAAGAAWLEDYLAAARNDTEELAPLLERDPDAVVKLAHRLAGASFSAGAMLLGEAARALERAAMAGGPLVALHAAVVCEYEAAAREIRRTVLAEVAPVPASLAADG